MALGLHSIPGLTPTCRLSAPCPRELQNPLRRFKHWDMSLISVQQARARKRSPSISTSYVPFQGAYGRVRGPSICIRTCKSTYAVSRSAAQQRTEAGRRFAGDRVSGQRIAHHRAQPVNSVRSLARENDTGQVSLGPEDTTTGNNGASPHTTAALKSPWTPGNSRFWPGMFRRRLSRALALSPNPGWSRLVQLRIGSWASYRGPALARCYCTGTVHGLCIGWDWIGLDWVCSVQSPAWRCSKSVSTEEATSLSLSLP
ncbi:hypothetical protein GGI42DRAFT_310068 [Trichoderma sp. SZMC 28013]